MIYSYRIYHRLILLDPPREPQWFRLWLLYLIHNEWNPYRKRLILFERSTGIPVNWWLRTIAMVTTNRKSIPSTEAKEDSKIVCKFTNHNIAHWKPSITPNESFIFSLEILTLFFGTKGSNFPFFQSFTFYYLIQHKNFNDGLRFFDFLKLLMHSHIHVDVMHY